MSSNRTPIILSPHNLVDRLGDRSLKIIYVGKEDKYAEAHIPGAARISHSALNYGIAPQVGHLPNVNDLESAFRNLGLCNHHHVICYDDDAGTAAARLFWVLEAMGHKGVSFLDGGFLAWSARHYPISSDTPEIETGDWRAVPNPDVIASKSEVLLSLDNPDIQILDARTEEEHMGLKSASDRKGHIPGAISFNWLQSRNTEHHNLLKPLEELQASLDERGLNKQKEIIAHCQTHQRSCHSYMMLRALGYPKVRGFAGSWSEWAADPNSPIINLQES